MKYYLYLFLSVGVLLSGVAAIYSVSGLTSIFKGAPLAILFMGITLEACKVLISIYVHSFWKKAPKMLLTYMVTALVILMFITSLGIYGYLSKAFASSTDTTLASTKIESLKMGIELEQGKIKISMDQISSINSTPAEEKTGWHYGRIRSLSREINTSNERLDKLNEEYAKERMVVGAIENEVGPLKYLAKLIYGEDDKDAITSSVQLFIILIVIVFDPLAILSIIGAIWGLEHISKSKTIEVNKEDILEIKEAINHETEEIEKILHPPMEQREEINPPEEEDVEVATSEEAVVDPIKEEWVAKETTIKEMEPEDIAVHESFLRPNQNSEIRDPEAIRKSNLEYSRKDRDALTKLYEEDAFKKGDYIE